jgi:4-hydroxy-2-oxoheptanedioate aldolase
MSPQAIELYGLAGLDFVIIGSEVEPLDYGPMENLLRAAAAVGIVPAIKLRRPDPNMVSDIMNFGGSLIITPHVTSAEQLKTLVAATRFGEHGTRGECAVARYTGYGTIPLEESRTAANTANRIIPIIEDVAAMNNLDEIMEVDGVDIVMIGPIDISRSLKTVEVGFRSKVVLEYIERIAESARKHGKSVMTPMWVTAEIVESIDKTIAWQIEQLVSRGITLIYRQDVHVLSDYYRNMLPIRGVRVRSEEETAAEELVAEQATATAEQAAAEQATADAASS